MQVNVDYVTLRINLLNQRPHKSISITDDTYTSILLKKFVLIQQVINQRRFSLIKQKLTFMRLHNSRAAASVPGRGTYVDSIRLRARLEGRFLSLAKIVAF